MTPPRVLYVEDSVMSQRIVRQLLGGIYDLTILPSPRQGIELLKTQTFHLLVTDYLFPAEDAIPLIQFARTLGSPAEFPIVVVSGSMDGTMMSKILKAGANDGVAKPLQGDAFRALLSTMLEKPYVKQLEKPVTEVTCFQWANQGTFYELCPELGVTVTASSPENVHAQMSALLHDRIGAGSRLGYIHSEKLVTHMVRERVAKGAA